MSPRDDPEQDSAGSNAAERRPADDAHNRDESSPSDSSRLASGSDVSGYLADEIGALDSMRHLGDPADEESDEASEPER